MSNGRRLFQHPDCPVPSDSYETQQRLLHLEALAKLEDRLEQVEAGVPCICGDRTNEKAVHRVKEPCFLPVKLTRKAGPGCDHSGTAPHFCDGEGRWRCVECGTHVRGPASCQEAAWGHDIEVGQFYRPRHTPDVLWLVVAVEQKGPFPIKMRRSDADDQTHVGGFTHRYLREEFELVAVVPVKELSALRDRGANAVLVPADQLAELQRKAAGK